MSFSEAVQPAEALIDIYKRIPITALDDFSDTQLNAISGQAKADCCRVAPATGNQSLVRIPTATSHNRELCIIGLM